MYKNIIDINIKNKSVKNGPDIWAAGNMNKSNDAIGKNLWYEFVFLIIILEARRT